MANRAGEHAGTSKLSDGAGSRPTVEMIRSGTHRSSTPRRCGCVGLTLVVGAPWKARKRFTSYTLPKPENSILTSSSVADRSTLAKKSCEGGKQQWMRDIEVGGHCAPGTWSDQKGTCGMRGRHRGTCRSSWFKPSICSSALSMQENVGAPVMD
eukprot:scaffold11170_cov19-Tisochrysis_lutea.AAC.2